MSHFARNRQFLLVAALATLAVRALTPDGYMPGSAQSGLLYEMCPEGMPAEIMQALAGDSHHHHHGSGDDAASPGSSEQCPIGHMLNLAVATDATATPDVLPDLPLFDEGAVAQIFGTQATGYRSRAPPA
jgi:hypothetical protein